MVRRGVLSRRYTCAWMSGSPAVRARKHLVHARTTALLATLRQPSNRFMMANSSSSLAGVYLAVSPMTMHCPQSVNSLRRPNR